MDRIIIAERKGAAARIALLEEKAVREIRYFDAGSAEQANALYLARVQTVRPALNAAFVDIGSETEAFLPLEGEKLRPGDYLIVQGFATQTNPDKRYRVSRKVQLSGRTLVYQPGRARVSVSSAIGNAADRQRLKALAERLLRQGEGVILRTAAETAAEAEIETELSAFREEWQALQRKAETERRPCVLRRYGFEDEIIGRFLNRPAGKVITSDEDCYRTLLEGRAGGWFDPQTELVLTGPEEPSPGVRWGVDAAEQAALNRTLWLPCGGYLTVDYCEAMTVYDVNSGKTASSGDEEETAFAVNLEAAAEIASHLRLCNTGGMIVIDFIDLRLPEHRQELVRAMKRACEGDSARINVFGLTHLGLMAMTRKRSGLQLRQVKRQVCPRCKGKGTIPNERFWEGIDG